jgi:hypothetical protein
MHPRRPFAVVAAGLMCVALLPAATTQKTAPPKTAASAPKKTATHKSPVRPATHRVTLSHTTPSHKTAPKPTAQKTPPHSSRPSQTEPTPERYKEFQEALIKKGYLQGEATGKWDEASADAMRRFQKDQNLEQTGKPNQSLSIIALGLGPQH